MRLVQVLLARCIFLLTHKLFHLQTQPLAWSQTGACIRGPRWIWRLVTLSPALSRGNTLYISLCCRGGKTSNKSTLVFLWMSKMKGHMECTIWSKIRYATSVFSFWFLEHSSHKPSCVCFNVTHSLNDCREGHQNELNITLLMTFTRHPFKPRCKSEADVDIHFLFIFRQAGLSAQFYSPPWEVFLLPWIYNAKR